MSSTNVIYFNEDIVDDTDLDSNHSLENIFPCVDEYESDIDFNIYLPTNSKEKRK